MGDVGKQYEGGIGDGRVKAREVTSCFVMSPDDASSLEARGRRGVG